MAAAIAYARPTLRHAWQAVLSHWATLLLVLLCGLAAGLLGLQSARLASLLVDIAIGSSRSRAIGLADTLTMAVSGVAQLPFSLLSSLLGILITATPALHDEQGGTIGPAAVMAVLPKRFGRYLLAGLLYWSSVALGLLLCVLPGIAVLLVTPVYVNRIFTSDASIPQCLSEAFQAVYGSPHSLRFLGIELLTSLGILVVSLGSCGVAGLLAIPVGSFYLQNCAYHLGILR